MMYVILGSFDSEVLLLLMCDYQTIRHWTHPRINIALTLFQSYQDLEEGDTQSVARPGLNYGPLALQTMSLNTKPSLLPLCF